MNVGTIRNGISYCVDIGFHGIEIPKIFFLLKAWSRGDTESDALYRAVDTKKS